MNKNNLPQIAVVGTGTLFPESLDSRSLWQNILEAKEATYIPQWAGFTMGFSGLMAGHKPDMVIITLGGNETAMPDPTIRAEPVRRLVKQVGDRPCIWIAARVIINPASAARYFARLAHIARSRGSLDRITPVIASATTALANSH